MCRKFASDQHSIVPSGTSWNSDLFKFPFGDAMLLSESTSRLLLASSPPASEINFLISFGTLPSQTWLAYTAPLELGVFLTSLCVLLREVDSRSVATMGSLNFGVGTRIHWLKPTCKPWLLRTLGRLLRPIGCFGLCNLTASCGSCFFLKFSSVLITTFRGEARRERQLYSRTAKQSAKAKW